MLRKQKAWITTTIIFQLLTAAIHSVSFFVKPVPTNDTEKQLIELMGTYKMDLGAGFKPSMGNILLSFSISFTLLLLFGGLLNILLLRSKAEASLAKRVFGLQTIIYGACFAAMASLTFPPPIICTGLIFIGCVGSWLSLRSNNTG